MVMWLTTQTIEFCVRIVDALKQVFLFTHIMLTHEAITIEQSSLFRRLRTKQPLMVVTRSPTLIYSFKFSLFFFLFLSFLLLQQFTHYFCSCTFLNNSCTITRQKIYQTNLHTHVHFLHSYYPIRNHYKDHPLHVLLLFYFLMFVLLLLLYSLIFLLFLLCLYS